VSPQESIEFGSTLDHITSLLKAHIPYVWVCTHEQRRFIKTLHKEVTESQNKELWTWSCNQGLLRYDPKEKVKHATGDFKDSQQPGIALALIDEYERAKDKKGSVWIMKDWHTVLSQPVPRIMRDMYQSLIKKQKALIVVSPMLAHGPSGQKGGMEPTLDKQVMVLNYELPDRDAIEERVRMSVAHMKKRHSGKKVDTKLEYNDEEYNEFSLALQGLTELEVDNALVTSICHLNRIDAKKLLREKKQIVQRGDILEYIEQSPTMNEVGGLDSAKKYFDTYSDQFTPEAREYGVEPLRGVLFTGVPGTGKSLLSKAIASCWGLPLLRLDVGKVMTGLVGGSEEKMRMVISQVEAIAPCVLWIDEIEKSLSGTKSSNFSDGGTLARVFGTLLTAMEERMDGVVTIATSNDIQALPPELIRRFNETMFVDLPVKEERAEILRIHMMKRGRDPDKLDINMDDLVDATHLFTGSELEKAIQEAIARAFRTKKKDISQFELLGAIKDTKVIAKVMKKNIDEIREWARDKARYASSLAEAAASPGNQVVTTKGGKELDLKGDLDNLDEVVKTKKEQAEEEHDKAGGEFAQYEGILDD